MSSSILLCIVGELAGSASAPQPLPFRSPSAHLPLPFSLETWTLGNWETWKLGNSAVFQLFSVVFNSFIPLSTVSAVFNHFQQDFLSVELNEQGVWNSWIFCKFLDHLNIGCGISHFFKIIKWKQLKKKVPCTNHPPNRWNNRIYIHFQEIE